VESLVLETLERELNDMAQAMEVVPEDVVRRARCRCAHYFRELGIEDPEVLASMSRVLVRRATELLGGTTTSSMKTRLVQMTLEVTDNYVQKWLVGIEKQIDLHGGISRCGEVAIRVRELLVIYPHAIESVETAVELLKTDKSLCMPAQPPNNPTKFACQPLTASSGGVLSELGSTCLKAFCLWLPAYKRRHA
jgi:hypothetical protein